MSKTAIPIQDTNIIPRFDLATEVLILQTRGRLEIQNKKSILLARSSPEELCHILLKENVTTLICGAIEDQYYEFLRWKGIEVFDAVVGEWSKAFTRWQTNQLTPGDIFEDRWVEGRKL